MAKAATPTIPAIQTKPQDIPSSRQIINVTIAVSPIEAIVICNDIVSKIWSKAVYEIVSLKQKTNPDIQIVAYENQQVHDECLEQGIIPEEHDVSVIMFTAFGKNLQVNLATKHDEEQLIILEWVKSIIGSTTAGTTLEKLRENFELIYPVQYLTLPTNQKNINNNV